VCNLHLDDLTRLRYPHVKVHERALPLGDIPGETIQTLAISVLDILSTPQKTKTIFKLAPLNQETFCPKHL